MSKNKKELSLKNKRLIVLFSLMAALIILFIASIFIGTSGMSFLDGLKALFRIGDETNIIIIYNIRLPRILAAIIAGIALAISGTIMQTVSNNDMASPSTLGVSNAAVLGANIAIIILGGGIISSHGGIVDISNPYVVAIFAFGFALLATLLVLGLAHFKKFRPSTTILIGVAMATFFTGLTTIIQYFANDTTLSSAIYWSFGDLGRASYDTLLILLIPTALSLIFFVIFSYRYNALLLGDDSAKTLGINLKAFRFISLLLASMLCGLTVSLFGIIGFIGLLAPQIMKRLVGNDHKILIITSALFGAVILLLCDILAKTILGGLSLPVGAITSIIGAPIFIVILLTRGKKHD